MTQSEIKIVARISEAQNSFLDDFAINFDSQKAREEFRNFLIEKGNGDADFPKIKGKITIIIEE